MEKKTWGNFLCKGLTMLVFMAGLLFLFAQESFAAEEETVRVAAWNRGGRFEENENGDLAGYDVDLIETIAEKCRFQVEYVWVSGPAEALEALDAGSVDLVTTMVKTADREEKYLFGANATGSTYSGLLTRADREDIVYEDMDKVSKCRIGYEGKSGRASSTIAYMKNMYGVTDLIPYDSIDEMRQALQQGDIDLMVTGANNVQKDEKVIDLFAPQEVYYLTDFGHVSLMNQIDSAFVSLTMSNPEYIHELQETYFPMYVNREYTKAELDYIGTCGTLTVGVPGNRPPISSYDEKTGAYSGIMIDILNRLSQETGLIFEYQTMEEGVTIPELLQNNTYDLIAPAPNQNNMDWVSDASVTEKIIDTTAVVATYEGKQLASGDKVRIGELEELKGFGTLLSTQYETVEEHPYKNQQEMLDALNRGEIDAILNNVYVWTYLMQSPKYAKLMVVPTIYSNYGYCIAGNRNSTDGILIDILNKGIRNVGNEDMDALIAKYTMGETYSYTFLDSIIRHRWAIAIVTLVLGLLVLFSIIRSGYYRKIQAKNEELLIANRSKSEFLSRMSHEIRTPLNAILGMAELGRDTADSKEETMVAFDKIKNSGKYLLGILNDVLDMSRIENEKIEFHLSDTDAHEFLNTIVNMIQPMAEQRGVSLVTDFEQMPQVMIKTDTLRAEQIYVNLLNNAIKFSKPEGKVEWKIVSIPIDEHQLKVICTIRDYGCGMSKEFQQNRLFEPFAQEHNKYSDTQPGTGLGLAIVKNLVEHMNGTIRVESEPEQGSTFTLEFIREVKEKSQMQSPKVEEKDTKDSHEELLGRHILLVEDHPLNIEIAKRILEKWGVIVEIAVDGKISTNLFRQSREGYYDVILMDIRMPVIDGLEATRFIRNLEREDAKTIPIIAMTANAFEEDMENAKRAGMNDFLVKPIDINQMYETLRKYCVK